MTKTPFERPFDFLDSLKASQIEVHIKDGKVFKGELKSFDSHLNLVLLIKEKSVFLKGDDILIIKDGN